MRNGKLSSEELKEYVLKKTSLRNPEIIQSAGLAEDCGAVRTNKFTFRLTTVRFREASRCAVSGPLSLLRPQLPKTSARL